MAHGLIRLCYACITFTTLLLQLTQVTAYTTGPDITQSWWRPGAAYHGAPVGGTSQGPIKAQPTYVRLIGGTTQREGWVQMYLYGKWTNLCGNYFRKDEAEVTCRSLGFPTGNTVHYAQYNPSYGPTIEVDCSWHGLRDMRFCSVIGVSNSYSCTRYNAWVECENYIRLVNGPDTNSGRVEVYYNGAWGTVCDDSFDRDDAYVICKMLNLTDSYSDVQAYGSAHFGHGSGNIVIDDLDCRSYKSDIAHCNSSPWLTHNCGHGEDAGVACAATAYHVTTDSDITQSWWRPGAAYHGAPVGGTTQGPIKAQPTYVRLIGGTTQRDGWVQMYLYGKWTNLCGNYFGKDEAEVTCRSLGFPTGNTVHYSQYNSSPGPTIQVDCSWHGLRDMRFCRVHGVSNSYSCTHYNARVECENYIRLVNGPDMYSGRVEVYYNGAWGTVCDDSFDRDDAYVICKMLNLTDSYSDVHVYGSAHFGSGRGNIVIDELKCHGYESDIAHCNSRVWLTHDCGHGEDVGVVCADVGSLTTSSRDTTPHGDSVRLANGFDNDSGRVEIYHNGAWYTVCDRYFGHAEAKVICNQLGYYNGERYGAVYTNNRFGSGNGRSINRIQCNGYESNINSCSFNGWYTGSCSHYDDVGIHCAGVYAEYTTDARELTTQPYGVSVRLANGFDNDSGRVEIYNNGVWYTVCDRYFGHAEAKVICRQLGYYNGERYGTVYTNSRFGRGNGISLNQIQCRGSESNINSCSFNNWYTGSCSHYDDVGIHCSGLADSTTQAYEPTTQPYVSLRLTGGQQGFVEVYINGRWGTVCSNLGSHVLSTVCRHLGYPSGHVVHRRVYNSGHVALAYLGCNGEYTNINNCYFNQGYNYAYCSSNYRLWVNCRDTYETTESVVTEVTDYGVPVRLVNGSNQHSGRVEVYHNGVWRSVCGQYFTHNQVKVICRQLGFFVGESYGNYYVDQRFGIGHSWPSWDRMQCYGYENDISGCQFYGWSTGRCGHNYDVAIDCTVPSVSSTVHVNCNENGWQLDLDMNRLRQIHPSAVASDIYLGENSCTGTESFGTLRFRQGLGQCLTNEIIRNDVLVYSNELIYAQHDRNHPFIIKSFNWTVPVECDVERNATSHGHLHHIEHSVTAEPPVIGHSKYSVNMTFYQDPNYAYEIQGNPLQVKVGSKVYVKVFTQTSDWNVKMRVHTCYTKPSGSAPDHLKYYIIKNGCEVDSNTHIILQYAHETRFVFQDFEYTTNHEGIYLNCDANFCDPNDYSSTCSQTCHSVVRRNTNVESP